MKPSYRQEFLLTSLANIEYDAHDARCDVKALGVLLENLSISFESNDAKVSSLTFYSVRYSYSYFKRRGIILPSLQPLIDLKIRVRIENRITESGPFLFGFQNEPNGRDTKLV